MHLINLKFGVGQGCIFFCMAILAGGKNDWKKGGIIHIFLPIGKIYMYIFHLGEKYKSGRGIGKKLISNVSVRAFSKKLCVSCIMYLDPKKSLYIV